MANGTVALPADTWVQIASSGLTAMTWKNVGTGSIHIAATVANSAPAGDHADWPDWARGTGEMAVDIGDLFPDPSGAAYVWAYSPGKPGRIWRSHA